MLIGIQNFCHSQNRGSFVLQCAQHCEPSTVAQMQTVFHTHCTQMVSLLKFKMPPLNCTILSSTPPTCVFSVVKSQVLSSAVLLFALRAAERLFPLVPPRVGFQLFCGRELHQTSLLEANQTSQMSRCLVVPELLHGLQKLSTTLLWTGHRQGHLWLATRS